MIAARPLGEVVETIWDRGGAPAHFLLAHLVLRVDPSPEALRWLSVVCALATVPLCLDLARRVAGPLAGAVAAVVAGPQLVGLLWPAFASS